jgi:hypothetical protein
VQQSQAVAVIWAMMLRLAALQAQPLPASARRQGCQRRRRQAMGGQTERQRELGVAAMQQSQAVAAIWPVMLRLAGLQARPLPASAGRHGCQRRRQATRGQMERQRIHGATAAEQQGSVAAVCPVMLQLAAL